MKKFKIFHHIDQKTIDAMYHHYAPVFVLSTGRCGSRFVHELLSMSEQARSYHEAFPHLMYFSHYAYRNQDKKEILRMMIQASRMELILDAFNENKIYMESNHCLSFFMPALNDLFPKCKFIHLMRHPADFVRSAIMKGWHCNDSIWESGRLRMQRPEWNEMSQIEKLAWLWTQTNKYLTDALSHLPCERVLTMKAEDMFSSIEAVKKIFCYCEIAVPESDRALRIFMKEPLNELLIHRDEPSNMKKISKFPPYSEWTPEIKNELHRYVSPLAKQYGYVL